jgi:two-component system sensor histidine kinase DegS
MTKKTSDASGSTAAALEAELGTLGRELGEIEMLIAQATAEAARHEQKRSQAAEKVGTLASAGADLKEQLDHSSQLVSLTRRAALMEAQVEVLEGKRKTLARFRDSLSRFSGQGLPEPGSADGDEMSDVPGPETASQGMSRMVLTAQEDLRREIARAMHDGPAQSLTNIVLQAQIVERLLATDTASARTEVGLLISMVQQTLEATKSFIFDVRPMVLDDLGLVPTLRRAARDRGRRAGIPVEFDSLGADRRLSMDIESGLFRIIDEALAAYLSVAPMTVSLQVDWSDGVEAMITARRGSAEEAAAAAAAAAVDEQKVPSGKSGKELPPALAAMMEDRKADRQAAAEKARDATIAALPANAWHEIQQRAASIGVDVELLDGGGTLRVAVPATESADATATADAATPASA